MDHDDNEYEFVYDVDYHDLVKEERERDGVGVKYLGWR